MRKKTARATLPPTKASPVPVISEMSTESSTLRDCEDGEDGNGAESSRVATAIDRETLPSSVVCNAAEKVASSSCKAHIGNDRKGSSIDEEDDNNDNSKDEDDDEIDIGACSLCHCALDYSDRAAFFKADREEDYKREENNNDDDHDDDDDDTEEFFFRPNDPYIPAELYDKSNALVYCDDCDRMYHQKCHFVPLVSLPRGKWSCLVCQSVRHMKQSNNNNKNSKSSTGGKSPKKGGPAKAKGKTKSQSATAESANGGEDWSSIVKHIDQLFLSPPVPAAKTWENKWEFSVRQLKATEWKAELTKRVKQASSTQGTNYRQAVAALTTLTSIKRNRNHHFASGRTPSQEVAQTLVKLYGARSNWREMCFSLDSIRRATNERWHVLQEFAKECTPEFIQRVLFPFGTKLQRRVEPRTPEMAQAMKEQNKPHSIPKEILMMEEKGAHKQQQARAKGGNKQQQQLTSPSRKSSKSKTVQNQSPRRARGSKHNPRDDADDDDDDDSGVSLENLRCAVCFGSTSTDENDLVMCDMNGCYRAYHMKCLQPEVTMQELATDDDWFCPLCTTLSKTMLHVQTQFMGDEWEEERLGREYTKSNSRSKKASSQDRQDDDDDSLKSWDAPEEVFPTAEQDLAAAIMMKQGKRTKATDDLVARILGVEQLSDHDDDDEVEDEHFDLESFEEERKRQYAERKNEEDEDASVGDDDEDEDSSHSSQATLVEMSSVELEIGRGELAALSGGESSDDDDDSDVSERKNRVRRSRRLQDDPPQRKEKRKSKSAEAAEKMEDLGEFDEANIIQGKRGRKPVNYIQLNEAIFGGVDDKDLDDADEFPIPSAQKRTKKEKESDDENDDDNEGGAEEQSADAENPSNDSGSEPGSKQAESSVDVSASALSSADGGKGETGTNGRRRKAKDTTTANGNKKKKGTTTTAKGANGSTPVHPFARLTGVSFASRNRRRSLDHATFTENRKKTHQKQNTENGANKKRRKTRRSGE